MHVAQPDDGLDPERELAARLTAGDEEAFTELYDRYFDDMYDFAFRSLRDRDAAADVVQSTFTKAWISLRKGNVIRNPKAWLFAIARNSVVDAARARARLIPVADAPAGSGLFMAAAAPGPEAALRDKELSSLVWSAATSLSVEEYTLLDLHVRRDLSIDELAETLRIRKGAAYTRISRLKSSLEASVTVEVLARRGRDNCEELDALVAAAGTGPITRSVRKEIERHLKTCPRCEESRKKFLAPLEIFAGLAPVAALPGLKGSIWAGISHDIEGAAAAGSGAGGTIAAGATRQAAKWWGAAAVGAAALITSAAIVFGGGAAGVEDPSDVRSTSHRVGVPSTTNVIDVSWSRQEDVQAYSVDWASTGALPDTDPDLPGTATGTSSPTLSAGTWYFSMRTQGTSGEWTSTVHLGPFIVTDEETPPPDEGPSDDELPPEVASDRTNSDRTNSDDSPLDLLLATAPQLPGSDTDGTDDGTDGDGNGNGDGDGNGNGDGDGNGDGNGEPPPPPLATIADASLVEGDGHMSFPVVLSSAAPGPVSLTFATEPGSASTGLDFVPVSSTVVVPKGDSSGTIPVEIVDDQIDEPDEDFSLVLTDIVGGKLGEVVATGTIVDDDEPPLASVTDVTVDESAGVAVFRITLSVTASELVHVHFETMEGTATKNADFGNKSGTASFPAGVGEVSVDVTIWNDPFDEADETFTLVLSNPLGLGILDGVGVGTIIDDDLPPPPPEPSPEPSPTETERPEPEPSESDGGND
jgi:RNA polymerase sigma factor (sigma-70 family)